MQQSFSSKNIEAKDIKSLFSNLSLGNTIPLKNNDEVMKWVVFADSFPVDSEACAGVLEGLNKELADKSILFGDGLKPSEADIVVFSALHSYVSGLSNTDKEKCANVLRWMDYIQNKEDFREAFEKIKVEKSVFEPENLKISEKVEAESISKKGNKSAEPNSKKGKSADSSSKKGDKSAESNTKKTIKEVAGDNKAVEEKKREQPEKDLVGKDAEVCVSLLNIQVGLIRKAYKHPSADSLLVEEIELGDGNVRQVVSGLAKFCSPDELTNRKVALITNVKPGKLRDVMSSGLVLCASNEDHTVVEPLLPPEGAEPGERVLFSGHDGKPEDVLNPKKKQLDKITPYLYTDENGIATFKGIPFMTSAGPCTSSIRKASIK
ncbi:hypothetical protein GIB67_026569 [Kingdonia uniflora]|uniref:Uncharacterized protein n=1 Tax=Kingdonia uniflora TaxID=39325 RepID=A0A7J7NNK2_9MAGN|nr:hypothetical protein GIB67_026569 [Kingdonia uniflora]